MSKMESLFAIYFLLSIQQVLTKLFVKFIRRNDKRNPQVVRTSADQIFTTF
jgi:hypothetical protein